MRVVFLHLDSTDFFFFVSYLDVDSELVLNAKDLRRGHFSARKTICWKKEINSLARENLKLALVPPD